MKQNNIEMLNDTLGIIEKGSYRIGEKTVRLKLSREMMEEAIVYLPDDVKEICGSGDFSHIHRLGRTACACENTDSFVLARKRTDEYAEDLNKPQAKPVLVLNLANPVNPGGGVRRGARAQEEDLCRKSTLLVSLEGESAAPYYSYNRSLNTYMGSDAVMIHPRVEIIKDENGDILSDTVIVAVMTCAAPMITYGLEGMSDEEYRSMVYGRITGMLKVAAYHGYRYLVLGAFGCGAFHNDAAVVSDLFYDALRDFDYDGMRAEDMFDRVDFAVMDHTPERYNYREFARNFSDFYRQEDQKETDRVLAEKKKKQQHLDAIRGCIYGGAVGDALGYQVKRLTKKDILDKYGPDGITGFDTAGTGGKALISSNTQMTLFTANGLLVGDTRGKMRGIRALPRTYVARAYLDWLKTQEKSFRDVNRHERFTAEGGISWLLDVPELFARRDPGKTCIAALKSGPGTGDDLKAATNNSKGCGGIVRVAPLAVNYHSDDLDTIDLEGAHIAGITHGHSLGCMPASVLVHVINRIVFPPAGKTMSLRDIVMEAKDTAARLFAGDPHLVELTGIIDRAVELAEGGTGDDTGNIRLLGKGLVAEETLGIALYCALKYKDDFSSGIIAAVSHGGAADATGAVAGSILGALTGYDAIADQWKKDLELSDVILETADDLCYGCMMSEYSSYRDPDWECRYIEMHRKPARKTSDGTKP